MFRAPMKPTIVEEIRKIRHEMDRKAGYDFDRYIEMLRENERRRLGREEKVTTDEQAECPGERDAHIQSHDVQTLAEEPKKYMRKKK